MSDACFHDPSFLVLFSCPENPAFKKMAKLYSEHDLLAKIFQHDIHILVIFLLKMNALLFLNAKVFVD